MENHNVSTSKILLETLDEDILITVTLSTPTKDIGIENKGLTPNDHVLAEVNAQISKVFNNNHETIMVQFMFSFDILVGHLIYVYILCHLYFIS